MSLKSILTFLCATIILSSCNSQEKEILPIRTEFASGDFVKIFEIVDEPCPLSLTIQENTQYIRLAVKLKLKYEASEECRLMDPQDINFTELLSIATVKLVNASGTEIQEIGVHEDETLKLKKFLLMAKGSEETIIFESKFHNPTGVQQWFDETVHFSPDNSATICIY